MKHFMTLNICSVTQRDQVLADFSTFNQNESKHPKLNDSKFEKDKDHLDDFYVEELCVLLYKKLSFVIKIIQIWPMDKQPWRENKYITERCYSKKTGQRPLISKQLKTAHYPNHQSYGQSI